MASTLLATATAATATAATATLAAGNPASTGAAPLATGQQSAPIRHVVEIMLENHTFDNLFGHLRGADGIPAGTTFPNPDESFDSAPPVRPIVAGPNQGSVGPELDNGRRAELMAMDRQANGNFAMDDYTQLPYDGMAAITTFPASDDPNLQYLATHYALAERNFQPEIAPTQPNVTAALAGSSDGWYYNNNPPAADKFHTIFDQLQTAGRSWRIFYGVPPSLLAGTIWDRYMPAGTDANLVGTDQFITDAAHGTLPDFSFVRPGIGYSEESPEDVSLGDAWVGQLVKAVMSSPDWATTVIFITYDEGGAFWDHLSPPQVDTAGYGTRTPMVVVSPYVRQGLISQTTTNLSVLSFMQHLWGLKPLDEANALAPDLFSSFNFDQVAKRPQLPPVTPPDTLRIAEGSGYSLSYTAKPGTAVAINLVAENPALDQDTAFSGPVTLEAIGPAGTGRARLPGSVRIAAGAGSFEVTFPSSGYWRIEASTSNGSRGWATIAVGTNADTP